MVSAFLVTVIKVVYTVARVQTPDPIGPDSILALSAA